jgi:hypothetical protein
VTYDQYKLQDFLNNLEGEIVSTSHIPPNGDAQVDV